MHKVFKMETYIGGTISSAEAKSEGIKTDKLELANIEDCKKQIVDGNAESAYAGKIKVQEGIFEFDYDKLEYVEVA